jgi:predicted neuraminidase
MGETWKKIGPLNDGREFNVIQPSILIYPDGKMQILCRTERAGRIYEGWSDDMGQTWSEMGPIELPNPDAGTDAIMLNDGRALLVYNHSSSDGRDREFLNVAVSRDGKKWQAALVLENQEGEYSYPAVIQTSDGLVHLTYTWKRERIKHVVLDPKIFNVKEIRNGEWPE